MMGMKGKFIKKLKSIKPIGYLKQDRILQAFASDGYVDSSPNITSHKSQTHIISHKKTEQKKLNENIVTEQEPDIIDVSELMRDLDYEETYFPEDLHDKENIGPPSKAKERGQLKNIGAEKELVENRNLGVLEDSRKTPLLEIDISSFRRPELNSGSLFDPNLLAAFQQAVIEHIKQSETEYETEPPLKSRRIEEEEEELEGVEEEQENENPLLRFQEKCPPGGSDSVILYTTTLRGIRKTFENCSSVRFLLESFRVVFFERDLSMHEEFKEELWKVLDGKELPPKLFIKGRYIGGAEEVLRLHEQGKFRVLFDGIPIDRATGPCEGCCGHRFRVCCNCNGSHKVLDDDGVWDRCSECNENGLILCPVCC